MDKDYPQPLQGKKYKVTRVFLDKNYKIRKMWKEMVCIQSATNNRDHHLFVAPNANKKLPLGSIVHPLSYKSTSKSVAIRKSDWPLWIPGEGVTIVPEPKNRTDGRAVASTSNEMIIFEEYLPELTIKKENNEKEISITTISKD